MQTRLQRDTKGFHAWKRELAVGIVAGLLAWGFLPEQEVMNEALAILAAVLAAVLIVPASEFAWNWLCAPVRIANDKVAVLQSQVNNYQAEHEQSSPFIFVGLKRYIHRKSGIASDSEVSAEVLNAKIKNTGYKTIEDIILKAEALNLNRLNMIPGKIDIRLEEFEHQSTKLHPKEEREFKVISIHFMDYGGIAILSSFENSKSRFKADLGDEYIISLTISGRDVLPATKEYLIEIKPGRIEWREAGT